MQPQYYQPQTTQGQPQPQYQPVPQQVYIQQPISQNIIAPTVNHFSQQMAPQQAYALIQPVPQQVIFSHDFLFSTSCCACKGICGTFEEKSTFQINPLGKFELENHINECCLCCQCTCCQCDCIRCNCRKHYISAPIYIIRNELILFEYWANGIAKLYIAGNFIMEYQETFENFCDMACGYWQQSQPQLFYSIPHFKELQGRSVKIAQDFNPCPEHPCNACGFLSCFGCCSTERNFTVQGLAQGSVTIKNTRTGGKACLKHIGCQDRCFDSFRFVDYPDFQIEFSNEVQNLDRIAIIFGLIHHSIYKKWSQHFWVGELGLKKLKYLGIQETIL